MVFRRGKMDGTTHAPIVRSVRRDASTPTSQGFPTVYRNGTDTEEFDVSGGDGWWEGEGEGKSALDLIDGPAGGPCLRNMTVSVSVRRSCAIVEGQEQLRIRYTVNRARWWDDRRP